MSFIRLEQVEKSFGKTRVLRGLNISIQERELVAIRGASGSGKSTLLYLLGGLDQPTSGKVIIDNKNLHDMSDEGLANFRNESVGFVFQFHFLLPSMTCRDNILLPARIGGKNLKQVEDDTAKLSEILGVNHCLSKYPFEISGGEQQRINIIRALSLRPKILLCDEPTGNLDSKNSEKVTTLLKNLSADFNATLLVVTHDDKVASHFPRKIVIEDGQIIG
jgi:ABC-type lipoprotein export system ATPase subunit